MVNNNGIPIEAKKPFETVYEIKNETPSFEEFMENYQEGNLNYADLSGGSVGENEGYGPCDYSNKNCRCYVNQTPPWVQLYIGCPANGCRASKYVENASSWIHRYCNGYIYISTTLELKCMKCYRVDDMWSWRFKCYDSDHQGGYEKSSPGVFLNALGFIGNDVDSRHPDVRSKMKIITIKLMEKAGW